LTGYHRKVADQPPFPHFYHPEIIMTSIEPPYCQYLKSMLPVGGFVQAVADEVPAVSPESSPVNVWGKAFERNQFGSLR
jgi:hypothetical protein